MRTDGSSFRLNSVASQELKEMKEKVKSRALMETRVQLAEEEAGRSNEYR